MGWMDRLAFQVHLETEERLVRMEVLEFRVSLDHLDLKEHQAPLACQDTRASLESKEMLALLDLRVQGDTGVQQDLLEPQENQDQLDQKDLWEKLVTQVHQESKGTLEQEDQEESGEQQASLEVWDP